MNSKIKKLVLQAVMIALATALSFIAMFRMPLGGDVTPASMLPILLVALMFGVRGSFMAALVYGIIQAAISFGIVLGWGLSTEVFIACLLLDYIIPYTGLCLAGFFMKEGKRTETRAYMGFLLAVVFRFICHFISGIVLFGTWENGALKVITHSVLYNGAFLLPELLICVVAAVAIMRVPVIKTMLLTKPSK